METTSLFAEQLNHYLSLATIIGGIAIVIFAGLVTYYALTNKKNKFLGMVSGYVLPLGFLTTLFGTFLTLYYEYGLQYLPCDLCWYQRIFLYPQVFMFAYAWYKKDTGILPYTFILSVVGLIIAIYHHMLQIGFDLYKPCSTALFAVSCAKPSFVEFGFVTFPFMAVVLFGFLSVVVVCAIRFNNK